MKRVITFSSVLLVIGALLNVYAQPTSSQNLDLNLTKDFRKMQVAALSNNWDYFDSLGPAFKSRFKKDLATSTGWACKFDSLSTEMHIVQSEDKLLRIFSWDELSGGTWHDIASFAQYKTSSGAIGAQQLDTDREMELGGYTDVIIREIHVVKMGDKTFYLTIGVGTHGAGHHHMIAQIFSINKKKLIKCTNCFESGEDLVVVSGRGYDPELKYDPPSKAISYNEFKEDEGNWMMPTGKTITLKIVDGMFKK